MPALIPINPVHGITHLDDDLGRIKLKGVLINGHIILRAF